MKKKDELRHCSFCKEQEFNNKYSLPLYEYFEDLICVDCFREKMTQETHKIKNDIATCEEDLEKLKCIRRELTQLQHALLILAKEIQKEDKT